MDEPAYSPWLLSGRMGARSSRSRIASQKYYVADHLQPESAERRAAGS
ncbi:MAG: hypothetical protein AVDCRST_MAG28-580 [uncultured Rubrobacteraceae bacterium]|uniref:Uncharacterized protein n=1 Tax=uncultured Rubrobacteraceae bacterium TaxID=349277 RepID=A0A6J4QN51_9ACTN|nr:MAG: hypothetical protein AVDCRST_MAG28-580 [uncultured Rubrobacteraceae bacterium]